MASSHSDKFNRDIINLTKYNVVNKFIAYIRPYENFEHAGGCSKIGLSYFTYDRWTLNNEFRSDIEYALKLLYVILKNISNNKGDRSKIILFIDSQLSLLEKLPGRPGLYKGESIVVGHPSISFYRGVSGIVMEHMINTPSDNFDTQFPTLKDEQILGIVRLCHYISEKIHTRNFIGSYKLNTALDAINQLFNPKLQTGTMISLLTNYKDHQDNHSFLRKQGLRSREGKPYHLRGILKEIILELEKSEEAKLETKEEKRMNR